MSENPQTPDSQKSEKGITIAGHVLGWPLYLLGIGAWGIAVIPYMIRRAQGTPTMTIEQGFAGLATVICLVLSGAGLLLIIAAVRKQGKTLLWTLAIVYLVVLFIGLAMSSG